MAILQGVTVQLIRRIETGDLDGFGHPIYAEKMVDVDNVLIAPVSGPEVSDNADPKGRKVVYQLGIPKTDTNNWENALVHLPYPFSGMYRTVGMSTAGIEAMIPLSWNRKVLVERYE